ncbi:MAG: ParA family protein [Candidatus Caldatribacterium sp.]|uniref:ParA family protein n=1 Tax=Candidatus Caldatribacterium sp. TaxID=2282143 RepID=UPI00299BB7C9|nr:ParA family protein [Candidatus Caldatribacterium sp.]MCX7731075.1 ParA family protein [Candidatus Caldatribacterium sp.]MDW8081275.1 ParA family protein [Candidatus Calescibacterium sp.]
MGTVVAVANQKGGVGKTTTCVNLGACLAERGHRVLIVDIDPQGNATSGLGINRRSLKQCVYDLLINGVEAGELLIETEVTDLWLLPSTIRLAGGEVELATLPERETRLKKGLQHLVPSFDWILVDCPPSLGLLTLNALTFAELLLVPIQCEYYALEGLGQLLSTIAMVRSAFNPHLELLGVLLTMFDPRTNLSQQVVDEVRKVFGEKVFRSIIPRNVRLSEAPSYGKPITLYEGSSKGAQAYRELAEEVLERIHDKAWSWQGA